MVPVVTVVSGVGGVTVMYDVMVDVDDDTTFSNVSGLLGNEGEKYSTARARKRCLILIRRSLEGTKQHNHFSARNMNNPYLLSALKKLPSL